MVFIRGPMGGLLRGPGGAIAWDTNCCCGGCSFHCTTCPDNVRVTLPTFVSGHPCCAALSGKVYDIAKTSGDSPCVYEKTSDFGSISPCTLESIKVTIEILEDCIVSITLLVLAPGGGGPPLNIHQSANTFTETEFNDICDDDLTFPMTGDSGTCTPTAEATIEFLV